MKKTYEKPILAVESFQLDAALAASCTGTGTSDSNCKYATINYTEDTCTYNNGQFFNLDNCQVDLTGPANDGNDTVCYHGPMLSGNVTFIYS